MAKRQQTSDAARVLVVDDAPATIEVVRRNLTSAGFAVLTASSVPQAVRLLEQSDVELVITDLNMPKIGGLDLVRHVRENHPLTEVMMITGYASIEGAVEAVKHGAEEYLAKPFTDDELLAAVRRALDKQRRRRLAQPCAAEPGEAPPGMLGESAAMRAVYRLIPRAASASATVLITGESGVGKELVARAVHYSGPRAAAPFMPVNCGGIPETLLESTLFGHVKGAFTGAGESRAGFFQTADGGTIFLDEVSEMSLAMQVKLLRVLQDKEIRMVGADKTQRVDVRIIAAANRDLRALVDKGAFREDLYFRLNVIGVHIPPLRERGDDILLLIRHFAAKYADEFGRPTPTFSDRVLDVLRGYQWPGNVRELENVIQRLVLMAESDRVDVSDLPAVMRFSVGGGFGLNRTLADVEREHVRAVLESVGGNKSQAARILGIDRKTLRQKLSPNGDDE